ncbi:MAG: T9SS C-terminal target domain-containing protein [Winogradskyella sp.]|uniref:T9SS type A sorting domain-containing protein n=1 Tax=Winogradskyella sp. TaxID=1883156 RepID=UPI000F3B2678|nr:T9SS type A sorting domain-containing protein [Winogradskyella sp.]RNC86407.1 MAG: T9SS C-terminal target domain-containing protein [Winogradskyella sp.]
MKTKLLLLFILCVASINAQTTFTYTGTGNWTDQANWSPSYPGDTAYDNSTLTFNIQGDCTILINSGVGTISATLNISGRLYINTSVPYGFAGANLDNGTLEFENLGDLLIGPPVSYTITGSGILKHNDLASITGFCVIQPGTATSSGTITFEGYWDIDGGFVDIDVFSDTDYDRIFANDLNIGSSVLTIIEQNGFFPTSSNTELEPLISTGTSVFTFTVFNYNVTNGYQPVYDYIAGDPTVRITFTDIEAPILSCIGDQNVNADCSVFYQLPDYSSIIGVSDNDEFSNLTFTQTPLNGLGATDGTEVTLTVTDTGGNSDSCSFTLNITNQTLANDDVDDIVSRNISLFPNPSSGQFLLKNTSGLNLIKADLIDVKGAKVHTIDLSTYVDTHHIDLTALNPAIYFFKIYTADGVATKKIIIE